MTQNSSTYIVAVSGGIDSVVLLHMLITHNQAVEAITRSNPSLVVAHINHGIRPDTSTRDQKFVQNLTEKYGLTFETTDLKLGADASEELARDKRYAFLDSLVNKYSANGILIAHHEDDVLETALLNIIRGTGRKGLSSLSSSASRVRPLLHMTKQEIRDYATKNSLEWVEDETNQDPKYLRNRVRGHLERATYEQKTAIAKQLQNVRIVNTVLNDEIAKILQYKIRGSTFIISRSWFVKLPHDIACEFMHAVLVRLKTTNLDRKLIESLVIALKVARPGTKIDVDKSTYALITKRSMRFTDRSTHRTMNVN